MRVKWGRPKSVHWSVVDDARLCHSSLQPSLTLRFAFTALMFMRLKGNVYLSNISRLKWRRWVYACACELPPLLLLLFLPFCFQPNFNLYESQTLTHTHTQPYSPVVSNFVLDLVKCYAINTWRIKFSMDENRIALRAYACMCVCIRVCGKHRVLSTSLLNSLHHNHFYYSSESPHEKNLKNISGG